MRSEKDFDFLLTIQLNNVFRRFTNFEFSLVHRLVRFDFLKLVVVIFILFSGESFNSGASRRGVR